MITPKTVPKSIPPAAAEPMVLTEAQLDEVTAGQNINVLNIGVAGVCVITGPCSNNQGIVFNQPTGP